MAIWKTAIFNKFLQENRKYRRGYWKTVIGYSGLTEHRLLFTDYWLLITGYWLLVTDCSVTTEESGDASTGDKTESSAKATAEVSFFHCMKYNQHISVPFIVPGSIQPSTMLRSSVLTNTVIVISSILSLRKKNEMPAAYSRISVSITAHCEHFFTHPSASVPWNWPKAAFAWHVNGEDISG